MGQYRRSGSYEVNELDTMDKVIESLLGAKACSLFIYKSKQRDLSYAKIQHKVLDLTIQENFPPKPNLTKRT